MKFLSIFLVFILLLSSTVNAQEKKNPLAGTTWKLISGKWATEDTTVTFPNSPYHQQILIYGKTHFNLVSQDTSRDYSFSCSATYTIDGDNYTATYKMFSNYVGIGKSFNLKFQIEGDQLIFKAAAGNRDFGYELKEWHNVWKRID